MLLDIRPDHLQIVEAILRRQVPDKEVWAFGSRAKWTARDTSDLDLAIIGEKPLDFGKLAAIRDDFSESNLPYKVDVVDWATTSETFRKIIERDKVVVQKVRGDLGIAVNHWPEVEVQDVCSLIVDCVNKTAPTVDYETPYRMIRTTNIRNGRLDLTDCRFVEKEVYEKWTRRAAVKAGDVLLTREAPIGEVGYVPEDQSIFLGQRIMQYRANPGALDSRFLLYSFLSPALRHQFGTHEGSGSVVSHIRVGDCFKFKIPLPPLEEQRAIAHILGTLDDKIELNRRMNATLEAMARAIFKSWFVDFDPVRAKAEGRAPEGLAPEIAALFPEGFEDSELGEIPAGWKVKALPEAIEVNPSRSLRKGEMAPYLDMANVPTNTARAAQVIEREFSSGTKFKNGDTLLARITPCLENGKTAYVDFLEEDQIGWGSTEFIVLRPKSPLPPEFAYFLARDQDFRAFAIANMSGTSGRQRVPADCFNRYLLTVPSPEISAAFGRFASDVMRKIKGNDEESRTLATLRDTLLPKLLSGELRVTDAYSTLDKVMP
jgi:type I restriction enzyme S subunit